MFSLAKLSTKQIDGLNIGLMIVSLILAYILPFELFLFSYAVLGPLHYLTEISWLHQKNYYVPATNKRSMWLFPIIALSVTFFMVIGDVLELFKIKYDDPFARWTTNMIFFLFGLASILVLLPKLWQKLVGVTALLLLCSLLNLNKECLTCTSRTNGKEIELCDYNQRKAETFISTKCADVDKDGYIKSGTDFHSKQPYYASLVFFSAYLPTLVHVYLFTMLFMLFGALKSGSKMGLVSVVVLVICGVLPFLYDPPFIQYSISDYAKRSYDVSFLNLNQLIFDDFRLGNGETVYTSRIGIMLTRFIAFAYTYHYLNWFSKTSIIQWHKMPLLNLGIVLVLWIGSVALYYMSYKTGLTMLLLLSFLHVFMEFPLNFQSFVGIFRALFGRKPVPAKV